MSVEEGYAAARAVGLNMRANIRSVVGPALDRVERVGQSPGMVMPRPDFNDMPKVITGFPDLFVEVFGPERGRGGAAPRWAWWRCPTRSPWRSKWCSRLTTECAAAWLAVALTTNKCYSFMIA